MFIILGCASCAYIKSWSSLLFLGLNPGLHISLHLYLSSFIPWTQGAFGFLLPAPNNSNGISGFCRVLLWHLFLHLVYANPEAGKPVALCCSQWWVPQQSPGSRCPATMAPKAAAHFYWFSLLLKCRLQSIVHEEDVKNVLHTVVAELWTIGDPWLV